jgi:hypothetical protein
MFANLFNEFRGFVFNPIFRGFLAWAGAQTTKQQNPRWVQQPATTARSKLANYSLDLRKT